MVSGVCTGTAIGREWYEESTLFDVRFHRKEIAA